MATTAESIQDGLRWIAGLLRIGLRRALILGVFVGLFAAAVVITTRERISDCSNVTVSQRALLDVLREPSTERSFQTSDVPACTDGQFSAPIDGIDGDMEMVTRQLQADGWVLETNYLPFFDLLWRRCFSFPAAGWEQIEITVDASRAGAVRIVRATAPESVEACDLERRDRSRNFP